MFVKVFIVFLLALYNDFIRALLGLYSKVFYTISVLQYKSKILSSLILILSIKLLFLTSVEYNSYLGTGKKLGVKVKYFNENKPLGTAGPISKIKKEIKINDYFFLINGDVYTEMNYKKMMTFAKKGSYDLVVGFIKKKYKNSLVF